MHAAQFSRIDDRSQGSIGLCSPSGAEAADHLAMNDRWAQGALADIVGRADIAAMQAHKQTVSILLIAALQPLGSGLRERTPDQPVTQSFNPSELRLELRS